MNRHLMALAFLGLVASAACSSTGESALDGPALGSSCESLGITECTGYQGKAAVAFCALDKKTGKPTWLLGRVCEGDCDFGQCVATGSDSTSPPDSISGDTKEETTPGEVSTDQVSEVGQDVPIEELLDQGCEPACNGKVCGPDGCGGSCGECIGGEVCLPGGTQCCTPQCFGKLCGDDGCGGQCGTCPEGMECGVYDQCVPKCVPKCEGKECGPDGCGKTCGTCPEGKACGADAKCSVCVPVCAGKECGSDGCGGSCGGCLFGYECQNDKCVKSCIPVCPNKNCGPDGCGGSCGECGVGEQCVDGRCLMVCNPNCDGRQCGPDGCGGVCGKCAPWEFCDGLGQCVTDCTPQCNGKVCGPDGCGALCGKCSSGAVCNSTGQCLTVGGPCSNLAPGGWCDGNTLVACVNNAITVTDCYSIGKNVVCEWLPALNYFGCVPKGECIPSCLGKNCGDDGCGGSCGDCPIGQACSFGQCTNVGQCGDVTYVGCCSGNTVLWCNNSALWFMDCSATNDPLKSHCGWNPDKGFYDCVAEAVEGPLQYPYYCGGTCVPSCIDRQCGDDGCGGSCGTCPTGLACENNHCVGVGGGCGPYNSQPQCVGDTVVWCENGQIVMFDCTLQGPNHACGWVPDLYVYQCYQKPCTPACSSKKCGPDGCGGNCGYCPSTQFCNDIGQCVNGIGPCGDINYIGVCDGNVVKWCQNSVLQVFDCDNLGPTFQCGWYEGGYYWCIN